MRVIVPMRWGSIWCSFVALLVLHFHSREASSLSVEEGQRSLPLSAPWLSHWSSPWSPWPAAGGASSSHLILPSSHKCQAVDPDLREGAVEVLWRQGYCVLHGADPERAFAAVYAELLLLMSLPCFLWENQTSEEHIVVPQHGLLASCLERWCEKGVLPRSEWMWQGSPKSLWQAVALNGSFLSR